PENANRIYDALRWLELDWDEGPHSQAERIDRHKNDIARLLHADHAYPNEGSPIYDLAVAVDDRDMGITHVVRGADHISNTPRQLMILKALGEHEPPV